MAYDMQIRQRKNMAMGNDKMPEQSFGCTDMQTCSVPHPDADGKGDHATAKDGARAAGRPVMHTSGKMPAQAMPDHGAH